MPFSKRNKTDFSWALFRTYGGLRNAVSVDGSADLSAMQSVQRRGSEEFAIVLRHCV